MAATPESLTWTAAGSQRPVDLAPDALARVNAALGAATQSQFVRADEAGTPTVAWGTDLAVSGSGTVRFGAPAATLLAVYGAAHVRVASGQGTVRCGYRGTSPWDVSARWDLATGSVVIAANGTDRATFSVTPPAAPFDFACVWHWDVVSAWHRTVGGAWQFIGAAQPFNAAAGIPSAAGWEGYFAATPAAGSTLHLSAFRAGHYGHTGIRDHSPVFHKDGRPYTDGTYNYFTGSAAGYGWSGSHMIAYRQPVGGGAIEVVGAVFPNGTNDHCGHVMWDDDAQVWRVVTANWSAWPVEGSSIDVMLGVLTGNPLQGAVTTSSYGPLGLGTFAYDPHLRWSAEHNHWRIVYHDGEGASLATSAALGGFVRTVHDVATFAEGMRHLKVDGVWYVAGGINAGYRVWSEDFLTLRGDVSLAGMPAGRAPPHPTFLPAPGGLRLLAFDTDIWPTGGGDYSWGTTYEFVAHWFQVDPPGPVVGGALRLSGGKLPGTLVSVT